MVNWILTGGMTNLRNQINAAYPGRDKTSDGTIGDYAHTQEKSGHNPDDTTADNAEWDGDSDNTPEVRAIDIDSDLIIGANGVDDAQVLVDHIRHLPGVSGVLRYMIYNGKIYSASNGWIAETYTGSSAHTEHIHFSGAYTQGSDNNTTFDYHLDEVPMALTTDDKNWISDEIKAQVIAALKTDGVVPAPTNAASYPTNPSWQTVSALTDIAGGWRQIKDQTNQILAAVVPPA